MNILIIGGASDARECRDKFGSLHEYNVASDHEGAKQYFADTEVVFDFVIGNDRSCVEVYRDECNATVFLNTSLVSLAEMCAEVKNQISCTVFGFCGLPTFLNREILEVSVRTQADETELRKVMALLKSDFVVVADRVGFVTPRVICMIINEAYYTLQDGTASKSDIDLAMKLGTNYPFGPFEWATKIGLQNVCRVLASVYNDTKDERYQICTLLEEESLQTSILP